MCRHAAFWIQDTRRGLGITCPVGGIKVADKKLRCAKLIASNVNIFCIKQLIFECRADIDGATQDRAALMINVRADGADAVGRKQGGGWHVTGDVPLLFRLVFDGVDGSG